MREVHVVESMQSFLPATSTILLRSTRMAKRLSDTHRMHSLIHHIIGRYFSMDILEEHSYGA